MLKELEGEFKCSRKYDVAILKLSSGQRIAMNCFTPLDQSKIGNQLQIKKTQTARFMGYPTNKNRKIFKQTKLKNRLYTYGDTITLHSDHKIEMKFDKKHVIDESNQQEVTAPDLYGVSGGPIFGASVSSESTLNGKPRPLIIGICTDWKTTTYRVSATNISIVMAIIN